jgi:hypothetical protein
VKIVFADLHRELPDILATLTHEQLLDFSSRVHTLTLALLARRGGPSGKDEEILTLAEAAEFLKLSPHTLRQKAKVHYASALANADSKHIRFRKSELLRLLRTRVPA